MTDPAELDRVLDHCKKLVDANQHAYVDPDALWIARFILDTLGVAFPCVFYQPRAEVDAVMLGDMEFGSREEALGVAAAIIRCALKLPEVK